VQQVRTLTRTFVAEWLELGSLKAGREIGEERRGEKRFKTDWK